MLLTKENLDMVFQQAKSHDSSKCINSFPSESYMYRGVKIIRDSESTRIETSGMNFYRELTEEQYDYFKEGWLVGVYTISLKKYQYNLERLELKVRDEMNGSKSMKVLEGHKTLRNTLNTKHELVSKKLNDLTNKK